MSQSAREHAEFASCQTFINCYLKEVDPGQWHEAGLRRPQSLNAPSAQGPFLLKVNLVHQNITLVLDVTYRSLVGRHRMSKVWLQHQHQECWQDTDWLAVVMLLVTEMYLVCGGPQCDALKLKKTELTYRFLESYQTMSRYLEQRHGDSSLLGDRFIDSEQAMLYGHWSHPTPKSRQGMLEWQQNVYAPELRGRFQLHYFAVKRVLVRQESSEGRSAEQIVADTLRESDPSLHPSDDEVVIPIHPLQAQWLLHQMPVQAAMATGCIRDLGKSGPYYTATSSVRTLYSESLGYMLKLSIPVKITNSLRFNQRHELEAGRVMASLLRKTGFCEKFPRFRLVADPAYITVELPGQRESGFEVILRSNPFIHGRDRGIHSIAALVQEALPRIDPASTDAASTSSRLYMIISNLANREQRSLEQVSRDWFQRYWECSIEPLIRLYDEHGIALEAHQQNSLLDVSTGYPRHYYYRDNQGFYLSPAYRHHLQALDESVLRTHELFYDEQIIRDRFSYYLIANQLFSVIHRFGADGLLKEEALLSLVVKRLVALEYRLKGVGRRFVRSLLVQKLLPYKGNLLTRLHDVDELTADLEQAVYTHISNPLAIFSYRMLEEVTSEVA